MEQLHDIVLNVHGAVACACHQNVSLTGSVIQLRTQITPEVMTLVHGLHSIEAVWQVGPGAVSVSVVATEDDFLLLC